MARRFHRRSAFHSGLRRTWSRRRGNFGVENRVPLTYGTFSKAFGALGGFVCRLAGDAAISALLCAPLCLFLRHARRSSSPPLLQALEIGMRQPQLRRRLWENADYFHQQLSRLGIDTGTSTTYVMPLVDRRPASGCIVSAMNCGAAGSGSLRWIIRRCRRTDLLPRLRHGAITPGPISTKRSTFSRIRSCQAWSRSTPE